MRKVVSYGGLVRVVVTPPIVMSTVLTATLSDGVDADHDRVSGGHLGAVRGTGVGGRRRRRVRRHRHRRGTDRRRVSLGVVDVGRHARRRPARPRPPASEGPRVGVRRAGEAHAARVGQGSRVTRNANPLSAWSSLPLTVTVKRPFGRIAPAGVIVIVPGRSVVRLAMEEDRGRRRVAAEVLGGIDDREVAGADRNREAERVARAALRDEVAARAGSARRTSARRCRSRPPRPAPAFRRARKRPR